MDAAMFDWNARQLNIPARPFNVSKCKRASPSRSRTPLLCRAAGRCTNLPDKMLSVHLADLIARGLARRSAAAVPRHHV
jgi:hypothetical protein